MKSVKASVILWVIAGICFLISSIIMIIDNKQMSFVLLNVVVSILSFINAYMEHRKSLK